MLAKKCLQEKCLQNANEMLAACRQNATTCRQNATTKCLQNADKMLQKEMLTNSKESSSSGSESEPSEDNLDIEELKQILPGQTINRRSSLCSKKTPCLNKPLHMPKAYPKKCEKCGEDEGVRHFCKANCPGPIKKVIGIRTYYNLAGKKVHDQATQTPPSFYEKVPKRRFMSSIGSAINEYESLANGSLHEEGFMSDTNAKSKNLQNFRIYKKEIEVRSENHKRVKSFLASAR